MRNFFKLLWYNVVDLTHHKSFYVMLTISLLMVLLLRGCYKQEYVVNGARVNSVTVAWHASIAAFHVIAAGSLLIALFLSLGGFRRDRDDGSVGYILSRPVKRLEYVLAKIAGQWIVATLFMVVLHATIVVVAYANSGGFIPGYLTASALCSLNVLFVVVMVNIVSLVLPDFAAALITLAVLGIGFFSESFHIMAGSELVKKAIPQAIDHPSLWRILWPKITSVQYFAVTFINNGSFQCMGPVHPLVNILGYSALLTVLLIWKFNREEL